MSTAARLEGRALAGAPAAPPAGHDAGGRAEGVPSIGAAEFAAVAAILQADARIHLSAPKRTLVESRLGRRLRAHGLSSFRDYVRLVRQDPDERSAMVVALTTNHTHFFREAHHFDHLRASVMPQLEARARARRPVRIWSAGCSSGEEVYTVAMCLLGTGRRVPEWLGGADVRLLATDLNPHVVEAVRQAVYGADGARAVPEPYRAAWMEPDGDGQYRMAAPARALVTARVLNLFGPWPMARSFDVIFCRNVMIYFNDEAKAELEARLAAQLAPGGTLYIGHSERLIGAAAAQLRPAGQTIYVKDPT
jgi:chemotaxis protein methyltransferase CheR